MRSLDRVLRGNGGDQYRERARLQQTQLHPAAVLHVRTLRRTTAVFEAGQIILPELASRPCGLRSEAREIVYSYCSSSIWSRGTSVKPLIGLTQNGFVLLCCGYLAGGIEALMQKPRGTKNKRKNRGRNRKAPTVKIVAELPKRPEPGKEFDLRERGKRSSRIVEFPQMKGREVQTVRFYSSADENTVSIAFRDQHVLSLHFEPALILTSSLLKLKRWDMDILKEWPPIHSEPRNPERGC